MINISQSLSLVLSITNRNRASVAFTGGNKERLIPGALILSADSELESTLQIDTSIHRCKDGQGQWMLK